MAHDAKEKERLEELASFHILGTGPEPLFDDITFLAARIFHVPIAAVSILDEHRNWYKSKVGIEQDEVPRKDAFCNVTIADMDLLVIEDTLEDERFKNNPFQIRFYAGAPLITSNGLALGTLCILDRNPRKFAAEDRELLLTLARQVMSHLEARKLHQIFEEKEEQNKLMRYCLDAAMVGFWEWDLTTQSLAWDHNMYRLYGVKEGKYTNNSEAWDQILYENDRNKAYADIKKSLDGTGEFQSHFRVKTDNTGLKTIAAKGKVLFSNEGKPIRMVGINWDISAETEKAEFFRGTFENSSLPIAVFDPQGLFSRVNKAFANLLGYTIDFFPGKKLTTFLDSHDFVKIQLKMEEAVQMKSSRIMSFESQCRHITGRLVPVLIRTQLFLTHDKSPAYFLLFVTDLTEQKKANDELIEKNKAILAERNRFENLVFAINQSAIVAHTDTEGNLTSVNAKFCEVSGYAEHELLGQNFRMLSSGTQSDRYFLKAWKVLNSGVAWNGEVSYCKKNKEIFWVESTIVPLMNSDGKIDHYIVISFEITKRKQLDDHLRESRELAKKASRAKSDFLSNMSHEIRTPLNGIIGMTDLLVGTELAAPQRKYANAILDSGKVLLHLINDILEFSKIESGKIELEIGETDLGHLLRGLVMPHQFQCTSKNIGFDFQPVELEQMIFADGGRLGQILNNLLSNSVKFTSKGKVSLKVEIMNQTSENITLLFKVEDTGIGIDAKYQKHLFKAFTQGESIFQKYGGTGLGLSIVKKLIDLMGGKLSFESKSGEGSSFQIEITFKKSATLVRAHSIENEFKKVPLKKLKGRVLIAEDNILNQSIVYEMLVDLGCQVAVADNGREVLRQLQKDSFDLILMDCRMPEMDGYECTKAIRSHDSEAIAKLRIIALTANASAEDRDRCLAVGMNSFISKPITKAKLFATLTTYLGDADAPVEHEKAPDALSGKVDHSIINDLLAMGRRKPSFFPRQRELFTTHAKAKLETLAAEIKNVNRKEIREIAHYLKGSSAGLGSLEMARLCKELELSVERLSEEELEKYRADINREFDVFVKYLNTIIVKQEGETP